MKKIVMTAVLAVIASPAFAANPTAPSVPEMDGGAAIGAIALLVGAMAIVRERSRRK